jgi:CubicO group peptidase (beta-lactamase class C family)
MKPLLFAFMLLLPAGLAAQPFDGLSEAIERGDFGKIDAVVISRHGEIIYEDYFRGAGPDDLLQVQSVTKSVGSALIGIAHRQGEIGLDQSLDTFFDSLYPMTQSPYMDKAAITVEQVLQQRHGIEWDETSTDYRDLVNPVGRMIDSGDWYEFTLSRPTDAPPGEKFTYSTGASTLMSRMIRVATGMAPDVFAAQELFGPLGIGPVHWEAWSEGGRGTGLTDWPNPDGDATLGFSLWLRARDMLKFGELYLNGGIHDGQRILDKAWVDASWTKYSHSGNSAFFPLPGWGHGYQWWIARIGDPLGRTWEVFFASGWGSKVIFIVPELGMVMVAAGQNYDWNGADVDAMLVTHVLPALNPRMDPRFNGAWYDLAADGQGLTLEVREDGVTVISFWYTYGEGGTQRWFLLQGTASGDHVDVIIYETSGGAFLVGDPPYTLTEVGSGRFTAIDCNHMDFEFEFAGFSATVPLTRLSGHCYSAPD